MFSAPKIIAHLILAFILGGLIGLEREAHGRVAGLRTHILVCLGSALIMLTSLHIFHLYHQIAKIDPARIAAGVITGIGFLGAGTILRCRASVHGLTTAASLWAVAGIGLASGSGFYVGAYTSMLLVLFVLLVMTKWERTLFKKDWHKVLIVDTHGQVQQLSNIRSVLSGHKARILDYEIKKRPGENKVTLELNLKLATKREDDLILAEAMQLKEVERVNWR